MLFILGILIGLLIVSGQALWKIGVEKTDLVISTSTIFSIDILRIIFSPLIILGAFAYAVATLCYILLLSKYDYTNLQTVVVSSSLIITFMAASLIFHEKINTINLMGVACLIVGVYLIVKF